MSQNQITATPEAVFPKTGLFSKMRENMKKSASTASTASGILHTLLICKSYSRWKKRCLYALPRVASGASGIHVSGIFNKPFYNQPNIRTLGNALLPEAVEAEGNFDKTKEDVKREK